MNHKIIKTDEELKKAQEILCNSPIVAWDTETSGLKWWKSHIFMHSFSNGDINYAIRNSNFNRTLLDDFLKSILQDKSKIILGQNLKFDKHHLKQTHGIEVLAQTRDTMLMSHLMDENQSTSLKPRVKAVLGFAIDDKEAVDEWLKNNIGANKDLWNFELVPSEIIEPYACMDVWFTYKLAQHYWPSIEQHFKTLFETDMKVLDILFKMEQNGLPVDLEYLNNYKAILEERLDINKKKVFVTFGEEFDVNSPNVIAEVLYQRMKLPVPKVTGKGANSTDDEALNQLDHPVAQGIREHRTISHMLNTFVMPIIEQGSSGILHPDFSVTRTRTGRFSCSDPNVQNITKNDELRRAFVAAPGEQMIFWDQSQIEMVGFAMYSKDNKMVEALKKGDDLHAMTAREVLGKQEVTKEERAMGKGTNFAMIYGVGKARLARYLTGYVGRKVEDMEAAIFKSKYLNAFPVVYLFQQQVMRTVQKSREPWGHFIVNKFGRVRRIDPQKAYTGVNHLVQGWAADLMKAAMVKIEEKFHPKWRQNIHDSIRIDVPVGDNDMFTHDVSRLLCDFPDVGLPIRCTVEKSSTNWAEVE
jgi:DNA polymerase I